MDDRLLPAQIDTKRYDLTGKQKELAEFAMGYEHAQSEFKTKHFVGNAQITPYQKYKQFLLELRTREESIELMLIQLEIKKAEIAVELEKGEQSNLPAFKNLCAMNARDKERESLLVERRLQQAIFERDQYVRLLEEMYTTGEAYLPDGMDLKDAITDVYLDAQLERDHWITRLSKQAALDLLAYGQIGTGNMEAITMLSDIDAAEVINVAIGYSNRLKNEMVNVEQKVLEEIKDTGLKSLDIHATRSNALNKSLNVSEKKALN
jgi:hypothetical protein